MVFHSFLCLARSTASSQSFLITLSHFVVGFPLGLLYADVAYSKGFFIGVSILAVIILLNHFSLLFLTILLHLFTWVSRYTFSFVTVSGHLTFKTKVSQKSSLVYIYLLAWALDHCQALFILKFIKIVIISIPEIYYTIVTH